MHTLRKMVMAAAAGAAVAHLWDPDRGRSRRARLRDQISGKARRSARRVERLRRHASADLYGIKQRIEHSMEPKPVIFLDDATLADKVRCELLGDPAVPKGSLSIDVHGGIVALRGQMNRPTDIRALERRARDIEGVLGVHNLLHTPGEPAPNKLAARRASGL